MKQDMCTLLPSHIPKLVYIHEHVAWLPPVNVRGTAVWVVHSDVAPPPDIILSLILDRFEVTVNNADARSGP